MTGKQKLGSHCTCWATALWSFPHRSLSVSPGRQQPQPSAVQHLPNHLWSIPDPSSSHPRPIHFLAEWHFQVTHIAALILKGFLPYCVPPYRKQTFGAASRGTSIISRGLKLCSSLRPCERPVGRTAWLSWLIFPKNKQRMTKWKKMTQSKYRIRVGAEIAHKLYPIDAVELWCNLYAHHASPWDPCA